MSKTLRNWDELGELKNKIKIEVNKGISFLELKTRLQELYPIKWSISEIEKAVKELLSDWFLFSTDEDYKNEKELKDHTFVYVSEWSTESLIDGTGKQNMSDALLFLMEHGIWHPDMERYGMTEEGESSNLVVEKEQKNSENKPEAFQTDSVVVVDKAQNSDLVYREIPEGQERVESSVKQVIKNMFAEEETEKKNKLSISEVLDLIQKIDTKKIAVEIAQWVLANVENFIDNHETLFRMYLSIDASMNMPECSLYQRLYLSVPESEDGEDMGQAWDSLDEKLEEAKAILDGDDEFNQALFKRMAFFYELTGMIVDEGVVKNIITHEMDGRVSINELMFDPISMTTTVSQGIGKNESGEIKESNEKVVVKQEEIPAGFAIEIEICMKPKKSRLPPMY